jgi:hypothetical protein
MSSVKYAVTLFQNLVETANSLKENDSTAREILDSIAGMQETLLQYQYDPKNELIEEDLKDLAQVTLDCNTKLTNYSKTDLFSKTMKFHTTKADSVKFEKMQDKQNDVMIDINTDVSMRNLTSIKDIKEKLKDIAKKLNDMSNSKYDTKKDFQNPEALKFWTKHYNQRYAATIAQVENDFRKYFDSEITPHNIEGCFGKCDYFGKEVPQDITTREFNKFFAEIWINPKAREKFLKSSEESESLTRNRQNSITGSQIQETPVLDFFKMPALEDEPIKTAAGEKELNVGITYTCTYPNGGSYKGLMDEMAKVREGEGIYTWSNGVEYKGTWVKNLNSGKGKLISGDTKLKGTWKARELDGNFAQKRKREIRLVGTRKLEADGRFRTNLIMKLDKTKISSFSGHFDDKLMSQDAHIVSGTLKDENSVDLKLKNLKNIDLMTLDKKVFLLNDTLEKTEYTGQSWGVIPHGEGKKIEGKRQYTGSFQLGKKQGKGKMVIDKREIEGTWENDINVGQGTVTVTQDGQKYVGDLIEGKYHGKGKLTLPDRVIEGDFVNGEFHGNIVISSLSSNKETIIYKGQGACDVYHGQCEKYEMNNVSYVGSLSHGKFNGLGKLTKKEYVYEGEFFMNKRSGNGKCIWSNNGKNGNMYEGEWFNDVPGGEGVYHDTVKKLRIKGNFAGEAPEVVLDAVVQDEKGRVQYEGMLKKSGEEYVFDGNGITYNVETGKPIHSGKFAKGKPLL